jgi:hypothetical protein
MIEIKELFIQSIQNNEVVKFLKGEENYKVPVPHMTPVYIPTDWTQIMPNIYKVYLEKPELNIKQLLEDTLIEMINDDNIALYAAVNIIYDHLLNNKLYHEAPFEMNKENLLPLLKNKLIQKQDDLKKDFRWMGKGQSEGLWSEIKRIDGRLKEETGTGIL